MVFSFAKFFSGLFPSYYRDEDTLKDVNGEGTLLRYVDTFGQAIDVNTIPVVEDLLKNVIDAAECDPRFLNHIAYTLGNPPDVMNTEALYRKLLLYIMAIYKIKGTIPSYKAFFNLLGFTVEITEYPCIDTYYDTGRIYDDPDGIWYDQYCCKCSDYSIAFGAQEDSCITNTYTPISQTTLANLLKVVFFLEPINAHLRSFDLLIKFCDIVNWCYADELTWETRQYYQYDTGILYDDGYEYDTYTPLVSSIISDQSCAPEPPAGPFLLQENLDLLLQENGSNIIIT